MSSFSARSRPVGAGGCDAWAGAEATNTIAATMPTSASLRSVCGKVASVPGTQPATLSGASRYGVPAFDPFPFSLLSVAASIAALYITLFILIAQRHDDDLSTRRDQLTLEIAILAEQKSAKTIALLEEMRRDSPGLANRRDDTVDALATPADPQIVLDAVKGADFAPGRMLRVRRAVRCPRAPVLRDQQVGLRPRLNQFGLQPLERRFQ